MGNNGLYILILVEILDKISKKEYNMSIKLRSLRENLWGEIMR